MLGGLAAGPPFNATTAIIRGRRRDATDEREAGAGWRSPYTIAALPTATRHDRGERRPTGGGEASACDRVGHLAIADPRLDEATANLILTERRLLESIVRSWPTDDPRHLPPRDQAEGGRGSSS
jgi:hypothetical protein